VFIHRSSRAGHWVTFDWGSREKCRGSLNEIVVSASSLQVILQLIAAYSHRHCFSLLLYVEVAPQSHSMPAIMDSFHEFLCNLKPQVPID
jgi:hypothetical protein